MPLSGPANSQSNAPALPAGTTAAQPDILYAPPADLSALIAKARHEQVPGQPAAPPQVLVRVDGYRALVEYRSGPTPPFVHDLDAELITVVDGDGTLIVGGTLVGAKRLNPGNQLGIAIDGGSSKVLVKGTTVFLPAGTAHHFAQIGPDGLTVIALHIPPRKPAL